MKNINHAIASMTGICILLGIIIGIQAKTVKKQITTIDVQRVSELSVELKKTMEENENLSRQLRESEKKIREYENSMSGDDKPLQLFKKELENTRKISGMTKLQGRGITVTLNDSRQTAKGNADANAYLVHAEDILSVINELNVAGAEAISINGQRIIGSSSVRCAGSVVNINGIKIATPFVITAIGDPDVLESALNFPGGVIDSLSPWGIEIIIKKQPNVIVEAYSQTIRFKEAKDVKEEEDNS